MAEVASPNALSLLAEFDDLNRCNLILNDGLAEEYFLSFLEFQAQWRQQLTTSITETGRLQKELQDALKAISTWEAKFTHARRLLDSEKKQRIRAENERDSLEKQMILARDLLFNDNRSKLNNETLEKLAFLNNTSNTRSSTHHATDAVQHGRLNTITEMNSTGNLLSDQSLSRSEDDLDESLVNRRRSWKRHRPSIPSVPPSVPISEDHSSAKKRCSSGNSKVGTNTNTTSINGNRVIATTTVTVDRCPGECSTNGRITASSTIEGVVNNEEIEAIIPPQTPKSSKAEFTNKFSSKIDSDDQYVTNFTASSIKKGKDDNIWPVGPNGMCSPRSISRIRQHTFSTKTIIKRENCTACNTKIGFAKTAVKCGDCRAICHLDCREKLPLPCVPSHTPNSNTVNQVRSIADYTPNVSPMVPALIIHCVNEVETRGLSEVGLYRVPGSEKDVKGLKDRFLKNKGTPPLTNIDINVICGCIKDFLRSLREPLITYTLWADFVSATEMADKNDSEATLYQAISELPQPNRDTLAFMMLHLQRVADCIECKMPITNLAKVFGPTIIGYSDNDPQPDSLFQQTTQQFSVMVRLLELSSDYWARFAVVTNSDGSSVVATPPLLRTPSLRPRINTMPQGTPHVISGHMPGVPTPRNLLMSTPSMTSSSRTNQTKSRGFFYTPESNSNTASRQRKFYDTPNRM